MDSKSNNIPTDYYSLELSSEQFAKISRLVYQISGINLYEGKEDLVKSRLLKRLNQLNISDFNQYLKYIANDKTGTEIGAMVDMLTTNKTNFFRESEHLNFLREEIIPGWGKGPIRIWSAGCSSGEEPYSIAITLCEAIHDIGKYDIKILATDISNRMMEQARQGLYDEELLKDMPRQLKYKYFNRIETRDSHGNIRYSHKYRVISQLQSMVSFAKLNLMGDWPMRGLFDVIFCRNVMIYFDRRTQENLVKRFSSVLRESGYLLVGHSESLTFLTKDYIYLKPAVYQKIKSTAMFHKKPEGFKGK
ncbi:MAG: protein-glutamate O-methyltransferase CheR [Syntrophaceae bacterium]|nr:protein-glutamate O-methyltransferase CheR [Syntrophaceae bacterium]